MSRRAIVKRGKLRRDRERLFPVRHIERDAGGNVARFTVTFASRSGCDSGIEPLSVYDARYGNPPLQFVRPEG